MAETTFNGNGRKIEAAVLYRLMVVFVTAVALPAGGVIGYRLVDQVDEIAKAVGALTTDVAVMKNDISYLKQK